MELTRLSCFTSENPTKTQRNDHTRYAFECSSWNNSISMIKTALPSLNHRSDAFLDWLLTNHASSVCFATNGESTKIDFWGKPWVPARENLWKSYCMQKINCWDVWSRRSAWQSVFQFGGQKWRNKKNQYFERCWKDQNAKLGKTVSCCQRKPLDKPQYAKK